MEPVSAKNTKFAESKDLKIVNLSAYGNQSRYYTPAEWIWLIEHAKYVVTDSFHCTVFSYLMQKQFITILNQSRGLTRYKLFDDLGVGNRICDSFNEVILQAQIDYISLPSLDQLRRHSLDFLRGALS